MTLFGTTFDGQQLMGLVSLVLMLVYLLLVYRGRRRSDRALTERFRNLKREAPKPEPKDPKRPWG